MFSFPKREERRQKWLQAVSEANGKVTEPTYICVEHFELKYLNKSDASWDLSNHDEVSTYDFNLNDAKVCMLIIIIKC